MVYMNRKGISPVIATVIIVAVAVAISIAVVGWIMGLWGTIAGGTESLKIYPDSYINSSSGVLMLHVRNTGSASAVIYKIEVAGVGSCNSNNGDIVVEPGDDIWIAVNVTKSSSIAWFYGTTLNESKIVNQFDSGGNATCSYVGTPTAGAYYLVKVYTKAGNVYQGNVGAK